MSVPQAGKLSRSVSTNLFNLSRLRLWTLVTSIPWVTSDQVFWITSFTVAGAFMIYYWGFRKTAIFALLIHVIVTFITELGLALLIVLNQVPKYYWKIDDFGISYVTVPLLIAATLVGNRVTRLIAGYLLFLLVYSTLISPPYFELSNCGHLLCAVAAILFVRREQQLQRSSLSTNRE